MKVTVKQSKYYLKQLEFGIHVHRSFGADDDMILCKHEDNVSFVFFLTFVWVEMDPSLFRSVEPLK